MIKVRKAIFFPAVIVYLVVSYYLLLVTSGGWHGLILILYGLPVLGIVLLLVIGLLIACIKNKVKRVDVPVLFLYGLLLLQIIYLFFAPSDCGGVPGNNSLFGILKGYGCSQIGSFTDASFKSGMQIYTSVVPFMRIVLGAYTIALIAFLVYGCKYAKSTIR